MANKKKNKSKPAKSDAAKKKTITKIPKQAASSKPEPVKESKAKDAAKEKEPKKVSNKNSAKKKKPNIFVRAWRFLKSVVAELKKVSWLTGEELAKSTAVVAGMVAVMTLLVWLADTGLGFMAAKLIGS